MSIRNDRWIRHFAQQGMIEPFTDSLIREGVLSYGVSSFGYDLRLSPKEFLIFRHVPGTVMNPKRFNPENLQRASCWHDNDGDFFILPAHSYGLGVAVEKISLPSNVTAVCLGKSTYARMGIIVNTTPAEAGWQGHLTLEFSNSSGADCRLYVNEGICQVLFFEGDECETSYSSRNGKYQYQEQNVVTARI